MGGYALRGIDKYNIYCPSEWVWGRNRDSKTVISPQLGPDHESYVIGGAIWRVPKGTGVDRYDGQVRFIRPSDTTAKDKNKTMSYVAYLVVLAVVVMLALTMTGGGFR